jgi:hypothetical protein
MAFLILWIGHLTLICRPVKRFALNPRQEKCRQALRAFGIFPKKKFDLRTG